MNEKELVCKLVFWDCCHQEEESEKQWGLSEHIFALLELVMG